MNCFTISIAGVPIAVSDHSGSLQQMCRKYLRDDLSPEITINAGTESGEIISVHREITEKLLDKSVLLMHGAAIATEGEAYIISAPSGTGKSYRAWKWIRQIPGSFFINGDKPYLRIEEEKVLACGSPWCGKERMNSNTMLPLRAVFFLERADETNVAKLSFAEALPELLSQTYRPADSAKMRKTLELLMQLDGKVDFYRFQSTKEPESVLAAYEAARPKRV